VTQNQNERAQKLETSLTTTWDAKVVTYDNDRFPFNEWVRERINLMGWAVEDLTTLHEVIPSEQVYKVSKQLCADTNLPEFRKMVHEFIRHEVAPQGKLEWPIAVQRFFNVRIMLPNKPQSIFPFHTGLLYGHGPASRSLWMPLTDVRPDSEINASMQIIDIEKSRGMIKHALDEKMSVDEMSEYFSKESWQCKAGPGSMVFFTQENIHGNFVNDTGKTRVSIDFRLGEGQFGDMLARKIPGGYFQPIPETLEAEEAFVPTDKALFHNGRSNVLYLNNATKMTDGWPVHLQRYSVYEYCNKIGLNYEFELFELEEMHYMPTLQYIMDKLKCNCVLYSVFALPEDRAFRAKILDACIENGTVMHFTNEDMIIANEADRQRVEDILEFARFGE
jgi:sporadic carbohydrate cluster 2OG-Fe(II) oxygenase/sporadic carbohydrate cluster protein (TIGR04323 family)